MGIVIIYFNFLYNGKGDVKVVFVKGDDFCFGVGFLVVELVVGEVKDDELVWVFGGDVFVEFLKIGIL